MKYNVLYINHTSEVGGAVLSLYNLILSISDYVNPIVLLPGYGGAYNFFSSKGTKCLVCTFRLNIREKNEYLYVIKFIPHYLRDILYNYKCVRFVSQQLDGYKIDLVHSNSSVFTIGVRIAKKLNAKHIWHIREFQNLDFDINPFLGWRNLKNKIYSADLVIAITKAVYNHFALYKANNAIYLWDAVCSKKDVIYQSQKKKYFFFCSANLCETKGVFVALEAFVRSKTYMDGYKLVLAGNVDEIEKNKILRYSQNNGILDYIEFIGYVKDTKEYFKNASAFLMCSKNEGLGRVTVEAMFYGTPVIAKRSGGTLDFVKDTNNGFLFSDVCECANLMRYVVYNDVSSIVFSAQNFAINNFSEEEYGKKIISLYNRLVSSSNVIL